MTTTKQTKQPAGSFKNSLFAVAGLALAATLNASAGEIGQAGDAALRRAAEAAVRTNPYLGVFDHVLVDVEGGRVRLSGSVEQRHRREAAANRVAQLPGVLEVLNDIEVQSSAPEDVSLRRRLFESVYFGGAIPGSQRPEWAVRILVSNGHVTLAGAVAGIDHERLQAMAWSAGARSVAIQHAQDTAAQVAAARR